MAEALSGKTNDSGAMQITKNYEYNTLMSMLQTSVSKHLLDEAFTMVWANDFYYQLIRYPKDEYEEKFHGRPDLYYPAHGYEDELAKLTEAVLRALSQGKPGYSVISRMPVKGGGHVWVRMVATFVDEYIGGHQVSYTAITDIDDLVRTRMEQSITYNSIPGFVAKFLIKRDMQIELLEANDQFKAFFGTDYDSQAVLQLNLDINREAIEPQLENAFAGRPVRLLTQMKNEQGQVLWMQVKGECVDWLGENPVYLLVYIDITDLTELREMQQKLERQAEQLKTALQAAESASRAKSDFLSRMSHDIRTPMNAIVGMTEVASSHLDDPGKVQSCLKKISISSQHLLGLINDVLDMSKIESGKMSLRSDEMFLPEVMENIVAILQPMVKAKRQQFSIRLRPLAHERYFCDSLRLRQCFINILSNASKFTPEEGRITVDVEEAPCEREGYSNLVFTFKDTGIGIKPEFLGNIFDAFTREQDTRVDKTEGSGLGMAITKKIVDLMGGEITVESEYSKGTAFTVRLPLQIDETEQCGCSLPDMRVLVVDDDETMCDYAVQMLASCDVKADWVSSGADAVRRVTDAHNANEGYDAVILDWVMPGQDGLETVGQIRARLGDRLPILIISAYDWTEIEDDAAGAGVSGFLPKPLFRSTLCRGLRKYVLGQEDHSLLRDSEKTYDFTGKRILLVEDNELNREIAEELLSVTGAQIDSAVDGAQGVEKFSRSPEGYYDLILMDIQMPVMNGYDAARAIRRMARGDAAGVVILAMTADVFSEDVAAAKEAGMNGHLSKPLDVSAMKNEIHKFIGRAE